MLARQRLADVARRGAHGAVRGCRHVAGRPSWRRARPSAALALTAGRLLVDTRPASTAFAPVALTLATGAGTVVADGPARYSAESTVTWASVGAVRLDGVPLGPTGTPLTCGDGVALPATEQSPSASPTPQPEPSVSLSPSASPSRSSASASPSRSPSRTPSTSPPDRVAPRILTANVEGALIFAGSCELGLATTAGLVAAVDGVDDRAQVLRVRADFSFRRGGRTGSVTLTWTWSGNSFRGTLGPFDEDRNDRIEVSFVAVDDAGNATGPTGAPGVCSAIAIGKTTTRCCVGSVPSRPGVCAASARAGCVRTTPSSVRTCSKCTAARTAARRRGWSWRMPSCAAPAAPGHSRFRCPNSTDVVVCLKAAATVALFREQTAPPAP